MSNHDDHEFEKHLKNALSKASRWEGSPRAIFQKVRRRLAPQSGFSRVRPRLALGMTALTLIVALGIYFQSQAFAPTVLKSDADPLPVVGSMEKFRELLGEYTYKGPYPGPIPSFGESRQNESSADKNYSGTNIQVRGVDEADIIKTDGTYLYQIRNQEITISKIYPDIQMRVASRVKLPETAYPLDMYLDGQYLTVVTADHSVTWDEPTTRDEATVQDKKMYSLVRWMPTNTRILVYDISNPEKPGKVRELEVEGSTVSTRKIGSVLYLVSQKWLHAFNLEQEPVLYYRDSADKTGQKEIGLDRISYFPGVLPEAFLTVMALDIADGRKTVEADVYLGSGRNVYMSAESLYVAMEQWSEGGEIYKPSTLVHKFSVAGTNLVYQGMGKVPGTILNQFSMDEYEGHFRIATTIHQDEVVNNVYILDGRMKIAGALEGLAPGEQIYSVRFMGEKGYLVTFEMIDPLFVLDLKSPTNPRVLGELKIPGFSNYLHPIDENTLLGIGRDTHVVTFNGQPMLRVNGLKLAIFDVSDVNKPKELYTEIIGDEGSYSDALHNHKAVLYYNDVLSLPVTVAESGRITFQGAVAYRVTKDTGFSLLGKVSHLPQGKPTIIHGMDYDLQILRSLIIDDTYYTISMGQVKANFLITGLPEMSKLALD
jgi:inhibitor of cysteine peptidase